MAYLVICKEIFLFAKLNIGFYLRENRVTLDFCDTEEGFFSYKDSVQPPHRPGL